MGAHTGTHIDAPAHFVPDGCTIESLPIDVLVGPAHVVDLSIVQERVYAADLERAGIPATTERLLVRTRNSGWTRDHEFRERFVALDASAADWCVEHGTRLIGMDYLSVEASGSESEGDPVHHRLLAARIVILEGLELAGIEPGPYQLLALPILAVAVEAAPARAFLIDYGAP